MGYDTTDARRELLDDVASAIDDIAVSLAALGAAHELLDERNAERLEEDLFKPVQGAYGRARRTHAAFAERSGLPARAFRPAAQPGPSVGLPRLLEDALGAADAADETLADLQDSMRPVEVGDAELRAGLADVRSQLGSLRGRSREFGRTLGR